MNKQVFKEIVAPLLAILFFCILGATAIAVSGCEEIEPKDTVEMSEHDPQSAYWEGNYMTWTYVLINGHRYIAVRYGAGDSLTFDVDHDVDCPKCHGVSPTENQTVPETSPSSDYEILFGKN